MVINMKIIDSEFGEIEINEQDTITFENGLYGFESIKTYVLINHDEHGVIMTMRSTESDVPQFVVLDPFAISRGYSPKLSKTDLKAFGSKTEKDLKYLVIAVVKENHLETVVNLKSPIVIDPDTRKAYQVILENDDYSMQFRVFDNKGAI